MGRAVKIYGRSYTAAQGWVSYSHTLSHDERRSLEGVAWEIATREAAQAYRWRIRNDRGNIGRSHAATVSARHILAAARSLYEIAADRLAVGTRQIERVE